MTSAKTHFRLLWRVWDVWTDPGNLQCCAGCVENGHFCVVLSCALSSGSSWYMQFRESPDSDAVAVIFVRLKVYTKKRGTTLTVVFVEIIGCAASIRCFFLACAKWSHIPTVMVWYIVLLSPEHLCELEFTLYLPLLACCWELFHHLYVAPNK